MSPKRFRRSNRTKSPPSRPQATDPNPPETATTQANVTQTFPSPQQRSLGHGSLDARMKTNPWLLEFSKSNAHIQIANFWTDPSDFPIHLQPTVRREYLTREDAEARWSYALKHMGKNHHRDAVFDPHTVFMTLQWPIIQLLPTARKLVLLRWSEKHNVQNVLAQTLSCLDGEPMRVKAPPEWIKFPPRHNWKHPVWTCMIIVSDLRSLLERKVAGAGEAEMTEMTLRAHVLEHTLRKLEAVLKFLAEHTDLRLKPDNHLDNGKDQWLQGGPQSEVNAHSPSSVSEILGPSLRHFPTGSTSKSARPHQRQSRQSGKVSTSDPSARPGSSVAEESRRELLIQGSAKEQRSQGKHTYGSDDPHSGTKKHKTTDRVNEVGAEHEEIHAKVEQRQGSSPDPSCFKNLAQDKAEGDKQTSGSSESDIGFSETELEDQNIAYSRMLLAQFHPARVYARNDAGTETESQRDEALQSNFEQADEFNDTGAGEEWTVVNSRGDNM